MKIAIYRSILVFTLFISLLGVQAQQKEIIVDYSSKQRPDSIYARPSDANQESIITNSSPSVYSENSTMALDSIRRELKMLRREIDNNKNTIADMQMNFRKSHKKFKIGTLLFVGGFLAFNVGAALLTSTPAGQAASPTDILLYVGGFGASVTGIIFMINSHKYIGKAGTVLYDRRYYNNNNTNTNNTYRYR